MAKKKLNTIGRSVDDTLKKQSGLTQKELFECTNWVNPPSLCDAPMGDAVFRFLYNRVVQFGRLCNSCTYADIAFGNGAGPGIYHGAVRTVYGTEGADIRKRIRRSLSRLQEQGFIKIIRIQRLGFLYVINYHFWLSQFTPTFPEKKQKLYQTLLEKTKWIDSISTNQWDAIDCRSEEEIVMDIEEALGKAQKISAEGEKKRERRTEKKKQISYPSVHHMISIINEYRAMRNMAQMEWTGKLRGQVGHFISSQEGETKTEQFAAAEREVRRAMDNWDIIRAKLKSASGREYFPASFNFSLFYSLRSSIRDMLDEREREKTIRRNAPTGRVTVSRGI